jgi:hypothetical protein
MICLWRKVRNGDRTALRAIPVCAPQPICVELTKSIRLTKSTRNGMQSSVLVSGGEGESLFKRPMEKP